MGNENSKRRRGIANEKQGKYIVKNKTRGEIRKEMKGKLTLTTGLLIILNCNLHSQVINSEVEKEKEALIETDRQFSKLSEEATIYDVFIEYAGEGATLFRLNTNPIIRVEEIKNYLKHHD